MLIHIMWKSKSKCLYARCHRIGHLSQIINRDKNPVCVFIIYIIEEPN